MAPLRIGFIGLSAAASGSGWAEIAHLPHLLKHPEKYRIVGLLNSSPENAKATIEKFRLAPSTKIYSSAEELAQDPDVDLVVNNTRVDVHHSVLLPSAKAGKNIYSEWPLGANLAQAKELNDAATASRSKTAVGLQAQFSPYVNKVKELVESGIIGRVLSTTWVGNAGNFGWEPTPLGLKYLGDKKIGGNMLTIHFGHNFDATLYALGAELSTFDSIIGNQRPNVKIINKATGEIVETIKKDTPDQVLLSGRLSNGALISFHLRGGTPFPGQKALIWRIYGEKGEIFVAAQSSAAVQIGTDDTTIQVHDLQSGKVEQITVDEGEYKEYINPTRNVARLYDSFVDGKWVPDWAWAVKRHALIEEIFRREEDGTQERAAQYVK